MLLFAMGTSIIAFAQSKERQDFNAYRMCAVDTIQKHKVLLNQKKYSILHKAIYKIITSPDFFKLDSGMRSWFYVEMSRITLKLGKPAESIAFLGMAVGDGSLDCEDIQDKDFRILFKTPGYKVLLDSVRLKSRRHLATLRDYAKYSEIHRKDLPSFTYQSKENTDLIRLKEGWKLEEIAGKGSDVFRVLNLLHWASKVVLHDGSAGMQGPMNACNLLEQCANGKQGLNCRGKAIILSEACLSLGYPARYVTCLPLDKNDTDCHVVTCVWLDSLSKWVYLDSCHDLYLTDDKGTMLSIVEFREHLISGKPIVISNSANHNGEKSSAEFYFNYMAKNLIKLRCPLENSFGIDSRRERRFVELLPEGIPINENYINHSTPDTFWAKPH